MAREKTKDEKGKARKKLSVKKEPVKDLEARKGKDVKGGMYPADSSPTYKTRY